MSLRPQKGDTSLEFSPPVSPYFPVSFHPPMTQKFFKRSFLVPFGIGLAVGALTLGSAFAAVRGSAIFSDVPVGSYYDAAVGEMNGLGIIKGYDATHFGPEDYVTRGQIAVLLKRLRDDIKGSATVSSSSSSVSSTVSSSSSSVASSSSSSSSSSAVYVPVSSSADAVHGSFHFTSSTFTIPDAAPSIAISVIRSGGSQGSVAVSYTLSAGTAVSGTDFNATTGVLSFDAGQTTKTISAAILKNAAATGNRTINLFLGSPTGGSTLIAPASAVITLTHTGTSTSSSSSSSSSSVAPAGTGGVLSFSAVGYSVMQDAGTATITVMRTGSMSATVGVTYSTSNGTATDGTDYTRASGTLSFAPNETSKTFTVPVTNKSTVTGTLTASLILSNPTGGASIGKISQATLSIIDDALGPYGSGSLLFQNAGYQVQESDGTAYIPVDRVNGLSNTITVSYSTFDDSAVHGTDYTATSGTLTFNPGESRKYILIPITARSGTQGSRSFNLQLSSPTNATLGATATVSVTIQG